MAIRLEKGQRINLEKSNGSKLENICVGVNWGAIKKKIGLDLLRPKPLIWMQVALNSMQMEMLLTKFGSDI